MVKAQGTRTGRLLLFIALLFGIATMHTVGHPSSGHGSGGSAVHTPLHADPAPAGDGTGAAAGAGAPAGVRGAVARGHAPPAASASTGHAPPAASVASVQDSSVQNLSVQDSSARDRGHAPSTTPGTFLRNSGPSPGVMDPMQVCLAVLGAFGVALLLLAGAWLRRRAAVPAPARAGRAARAPASPRPPPPRIRLAQLSVLRI
ncbi:hypothetical protein ACIQ9E_20105 [Streptomyces sp. NPDC094448]|uniref:hypothetical protein n=1 Tax=Streptomyces sp. NPDC094448 TaxID=3366063 RepID=UPI00381222F0